MISSLPKYFLQIEQYYDVKSLKCFAKRGNGYNTYAFEFIDEMLPLFTILNASLNLFIYCFAGLRFRKEMYKILGWTGWTRRFAAATNTTTDAVEMEQTLRSRISSDVKNE